MSVIGDCIALSKPCNQDVQIFIDEKILNIELQRKSVFQDNRILQQLLQKLFQVFCDLNLEFKVS